MRDIYDEVRALMFMYMQQFLTAASPFYVYDEWCTRCKSRDTCPDIPVWLKNGVSSHSYIGHWWLANVFYDLNEQLFLK